MGEVTRDQRLHDLLLSLFTGDELHRFVRRELTDNGSTLAAELPAPTVSPAVLVDAVHQLVVHHGLLHELFEHLRSKFPARSEEILAVQALWVKVPWTWKDDILRALGKVLSDRLRREEDVLSALEEAGIENFTLTRGTSAMERWQALLEHARRQGKVSRLVAVAQRLRGGEDRELLDLIESVVEESDQRTPAAPKRTLVGGATVGRSVLDATVPLWRSERIQDQLIFFPPEDGFECGDFTVRRFALAFDRSSELFLGKIAEHEGERNDFVLPHGTVSRRALRLTLRDRRIYLERREECTSFVKVSANELRKRDQQRLHHGQKITIGQVKGVFADGRFTRHEEKELIDPSTGLLDQEGLVLELAQALRRTHQCPLMLVRHVSPGMDSVALALALHAAAFDLPVARLGEDAAILLTQSRPPQSVFAALQAAVGAPLLAGHHTIKGSPVEAAGRIAEVREALDHHARRSNHDGLFDLTNDVFTALDPTLFQQVAAQELGRGGVVLLVALDEIDRLRELDTHTIPQLELELFQLLAGKVGPGASFLRAGPGVIACALPNKPDAINWEVERAWEKRGPAGNGLVQIASRVKTEFVSVDGLVDLTRKIAGMSQGPVATAEHLPLPFALSIRELHADPENSFAKKDVLLTLIEACSRFVPAILACAATQRTDSGRLPRLRPHPTNDKNGLAAWWALAVESGRTLKATPGPIGEVARAWLRTDGELAGWIVDILRLVEDLHANQGRGSRSYLNRELPRIERALGGLFEPIQGFGGWTLIGVDGIERHDTRDAINYIDYTGCFERGTSRRITVQNSLALGRFVYLMRFGEGIALPLEPFFRRRTCPICGEDELFMAEEPILRPGIHRYRNIHAGQGIDHALEDVVTAAQIPPGLREQ